jgi:murein DD-endopeptidase MepM/ murein hydrolase activator NlpD
MIAPSARFVNRGRAGVAERFPHPGGLRETDDQRWQRRHNQENWESERQDRSSATVRNRPPEENDRDPMHWWRMPVEGGRIREPDAQGEGHSGARRNDGTIENPRLRPHEGLDIEAAPGASVVSPVDGEIQEIRPNARGGGSITIRTRDGHDFIINYVHGIEGLTPGAQVRAGDTQIGTAADNRQRYSDARGMTNHIHMEVRKDDRRRNPRPFLRRQ